MINLDIVKRAFNSLALVTGAMCNKDFLQGTLLEVLVG
jgi:hypothetical protein